MDKFFNKLNGIPIVKKPKAIAKLSSQPYNIYKIPLVPYFNSGIETIGTAYCMVGRKLLNKKNSIVLLYLNHSYKILMTRTLNLDSNHEDPRIIEFHNQHVMITTYQMGFAANKTPRRGARGDMAFTILREGKILKSQRINYREQHIREKNWSPFIWDDKFYLIYSIFPHVVLELDLESGGVKNKVESSIRFPWRGIPRGGTPAIPFQGNYISFFHSSLPAPKKKYLMGAYVFEGSPPFKILAYSKEPIEINEPGFYERNLMNRHQVIFPCGIINKDGKFIVSCGVNDSYTKIVEFNHDYILNNLVWIK